MLAHCLKITQHFELCKVLFLTVYKILQITVGLSRFDVLNLKMCLYFDGIFFFSPREKLKSFAEVWKINDSQELQKWKSACEPEDERKDSF